MAVVLPRSTWTSVGPVAPLTDLVASEVLGVAIHWPGTDGPIGDPGKTAIATRLEGYRRYHTAEPPNGHGWSDIAYNLAVDQAGRIWTLRGVTKRSAANGSTEVNRQYVAILAMVGPGETPTPALIEGVRVARQAVLKAFPKATEIKGHKDVRPSPTQCPGDAITALIKQGAFSSSPIPATPGPAVVLKRPLARGAVGKDVSALQRALNLRQDPDTRVDGDFGLDTEKAVKRFQRKKWPLRPSYWDGVVGPLTAAALGWGFKP